MSSVIVINGVPEGCLVSDIHRALLMYGTARDIVLHPMANGQRMQAVVTMRSVQEAQAVLSQRSISIQGSLVSVSPGAPPAAQGHVHNATQMHPSQPQGHQHQHQHQHMSPAAQRPYSSPNPYDMGTNTTQSHHHHHHHGLHHHQHSQAPMQSQPYSSSPNNSHHAGGSSGALSSNRLRVVVEDCRYPITRDVLMQMFNLVAPPVHVQCGPSGSVTTGSVEYADATTASLAVQRFNNNAIYPECCYVRLSYEPTQTQSHPQPYQQQSPPPPQHQQQPYHPLPPQHHQHHQHHQQLQPQQPYAGRGGGGGAYNQPSYDPYSNPIPDPGVDAAMMGYGQQLPPQQPHYGGGGPMPMHTSRGGRGFGMRGAGRGGMYGDFDPYANPYAPPAYGGGGRGGGVGARMPMPQEATVMISNVSETVSLYDLWVLLEVYGNVNSLKRMFKGKLNVVAQFQNALDAKTAVNYLNGCVFHGNTLALKHFAGYVERGGRVEWNAGPATDPTTQAVLFTSGYHHRTKPSASFNPLGRVRPDRNLFVSNLVEDISDDELKNEFVQAGCEMEEYYRKNPTVSIVSFATTDAAIRALVAVHARQVKDRYLRVTFSRYPPGPRPDGEADESEEAAGGSGGAPKPSPTATEPVQVAPTPQPPA